jgi:hypothetical protein
MRRFFLRGVMAVTEAGGTLTKTVSQHCDGGDNVPTYSIDHRKHGLRLGYLPWFHDRRVRTPRPGPKRPTRTLSRLPGPPPLPKGRGGLARSIRSMTSTRSSVTHGGRRAVPSTAPPRSPSSSRPARAGCTTSSPTRRSDCGRRRRSHPRAVHVKPTEKNRATGLAAARVVPYQSRN